MKQLRYTFLLLFSFINSYSIPPIDLTGKENSFETPVVDFSTVTGTSDFFEPLITNKSEAAPSVPIDTMSIKKRALHFATVGDSKNSTLYLEKYLKLKFNTAIFSHEGFLNIQNSPSFQELKEKYEPSFSVWSFIYFYVALIGFYIAIIINLNRKIDLAPRILISLFIFIHSFFILHICLNLTNYQYEFPHSYLMSTVFSFLYGPLLYFYFKRITQKYVFKKQDLLHLLPTFIFLVYIVPIYMMSAAEKLNLMLERVSSGLNAGDSNSLVIIVVAKLISLSVYGYFIHKVYLKSKRNNDLSSESYQWQKNIYGIHILYVITYAIYGLAISNHISSGILYHTPIVFMALMVLYVGYSANVQPDVFNGIYSFGNRMVFKYEKSGLTDSLSNELRENLVRLFNEEKIFKENDINLEQLADRLNTTRHNASQVINEHFQMNFHELINRYRINEAKSILEMDNQNNLHIIDIAYEVGYNNKVTFNKAFKKETNLTPSQYQKGILRVQV